MLIASAQMVEKKDPLDTEQNGNENEPLVQPPAPQSPTSEQGTTSEAQNTSGTEPMDTTTPVEVSINFLHFCAKH